MSASERTPASERLRALDGAATPGPWYDIGFGQVTSDGKYVLADLRRDPDAGTFSTMDSDTSLIAALRNALPLIADVVEAAEALVGGTPSAFEGTRIVARLTALREHLEAT